MQAAACSPSTLKAVQPAGRAVAPACFRGLLGQRAAPSPLHHATSIFTQRLHVAAAGTATIEPGLSTVAAAAGEGAAPQVVLTREKGKNSKLQKALEARGITCLEMPLIETGTGPDREALPEALRSHRFDWVCITSPESASVFIEGWRAAGRPQVRVAAVGHGTGVVLTEAEGEVLRPQFVPTAQADAVHFSAELPYIEGGSNTVLYPASNKAASTLQDGLAARGFVVTRLNTYDTLPVASVDPEVLEQAKRALVVTSGSPSTIKSWVKLVGDQSVVDVAVACIGSTSARAAEKLGLGRIYYPEDPGMEGLISSIEEALADCAKGKSA